MCLKLASGFKVFEMQEHRCTHAQRNGLKLVFTGGYKGYKAVKFRDWDNQVQCVMYIANRFSYKYTHSPRHQKASVHQLFFMLSVTAV